MKFLPIGIQHFDVQQEKNNIYAGNGVMRPCIEAMRPCIESMRPCIEVMRPRIKVMRPRIEVMTTVIMDKRSKVLFLNRLNN